MFSNDEKAEPTQHKARVVVALNSDFALSEEILNEEWTI